MDIRLQLPLVVPLMVVHDDDDYDIAVDMDAWEVDGIVETDLVLLQRSPLQLQDDYDMWEAVVQRIHHDTVAALAYDEAIDVVDMDSHAEDDHSSHDVLYNTVEVGQLGGVLHVGLDDAARDVHTLDDHVSHLPHDEEASEDCNCDDIKDVSSTRQVVARIDIHLQMFQDLLLLVIVAA